MKLLWAVLLLVVSTAAVGGQENRWVVWITSLQSLETALSGGGDADTLGMVRQRLHTLRAEIAASLSSDPDLGYDPAPLPARFGSAEEAIEAVTALRTVVEEAARRRPDGPFHLGRVEVNVSASAPQIPTAHSVERSDFLRHNLIRTPAALQRISGVTVHKVGSRNETAVFVRGFDARQVPLYIDGIPVYVPYDGYVDLGRFVTFDVAEIQVAKGFSSSLYGPNALGGAINVISSEPSTGLHVEAGAGYASGNEKSGFLNAGTRWDRFWIQGGVSGVDANFFPLSDDFVTNPLQPDHRRLNSWQTDYKGSIKVAWAPSEKDRYVFSYLNQRGEKAQPPYAGLDPTVRVRYWQWPQWDKESFAAATQTTINSQTYLRARLYYDRFDNLLSAFDDGTYSTQQRRSSFNSPYDDDTYGAIVELGSHRWHSHTLKGSFYYKDDTHRDGNIGEPPRSFRDRTFSMGVEDTFTLTDRASLILGFSADHLTVLNAEDFQNGQVLPFPPSNTWAWNPQAGFFYALDGSSRLHATFGRKTRLPTMKDRYSYRLGRAIPNPDLREEISLNTEIGYSRLFGGRTFFEVAGFHSDIEDSTQQVFVQPNIYQFQNVGQSRHLGAEASVRSSIGQRFTVSANYTYLSRKNTSRPEFIPIDTPRHKLYAALTARLLPRLMIVSDLLYEAVRWTQNDAGLYLRASTFANAGLSAEFDVGSGVSVQGGVSNLFDRNYFLMEGYPEPGRSGFVNLRYRF